MTSEGDAQVRVLQPFGAGLQSLGGLWCLLVSGIWLRQRGPFLKLWTRRSAALLGRPVLGRPCRCEAGAPGHAEPLRSAVGRARGWATYVATDLLTTTDMLLGSGATS